MDADTEFSLMEAVAGKMGRRLINVLGDGSCFYRALSVRLFGHESHHSILRGFACHHLRQIALQAELPEFWPSLEEIAKHGSCADGFKEVEQPHIYSLCERLRAVVVVIGINDDGKAYEVVHSPSDCGTLPNVLVVGYLEKGCHYVLLGGLESGTPGPGYRWKPPLLPSDPSAVALSENPDFTVVTNARNEAARAEPGDNEDDSNPLSIRPAWPCPSGGCESRTRTPAEMKRHVAANHPTEQLSIFRCLSCDYGTNEEKTLRNHSMQEHKNSYPLYCPSQLDQGAGACDRRFQTVRAVQAHLKNFSEHGELREALLACSVCGSIFHADSSLRTHMQQHQSTRPKFECPLRCGKTFTRKGGATDHYNQVHIGIKRQKKNTRA